MPTATDRLKTYVTSDIVSQLLVVPDVHWIYCSTAFAPPRSGGRDNSRRGLMTVTILSVLVLLSGLVPPDADRLDLWDAACVATGALDAQGVIDGAPPRLGVLCCDLSQLDVDA